MGVGRINLSSKNDVFQEQSYGDNIFFLDKVDSEVKGYLRFFLDKLLYLYLNSYCNSL